MKIKDLTNIHVIHCPTKELAIQVSILYNKPTQVNYYNNYKKDFSLNLIADEYSSIDWYKKNSYIIIKAEDFIKDNIKQEIINQYEIY